MICLGYAAFGRVMPHLRDLCRVLTSYAAFARRMPCLDSCIAVIFFLLYDISRAQWVLTLYWFGYR